MFSFRVTWQPQSRRLRQTAIWKGYEGFRPCWCLLEKSLTFDSLWCCCIQTVLVLFLSQSGGSVVAYTSHHNRRRRQGRLVIFYQTALENACMPWHFKALSFALYSRRLNVTDKCSNTVMVIGMYSQSKGQDRKVLTWGTTPPTPAVCDVSTCRHNSGAFSSLTPVKISPVQSGTLVSVRLMWMECEWKAQLNHHNAKIHIKQSMR